MSAGTGQLTVGAEGHVVQFYGGDRELAASVAGYRAGGIEAGDMVVVGATQPHRLAFEAAVGGLVRRVTSAGRLVRIYAEMVALLRDAGRGHPGREAGRTLERSPFAVSVLAAVRVPRSACN